METITKTYALFEGRHELPPNEGALCLGFDFATRRVVKSPLWDEAIETLCKGGQVSLIVTGLTPALTQFLSEAVTERIEYYACFEDAYGIHRGTLLLLHYDSQTGQYWEQVI
jgi:hypothetical protein